jgi:hypothetical protein
LILGPARSNAKRLFPNGIEQRRLAMIRFLLRTLGVVFLAIAFIFLVIDGTKSIAANALFPPLLTPLNETWTQLHEIVHAPSLQQLQLAIEQVSPWLWDLTLAVFSAPTFAVIGAIGVILVVIGRRKKPLIGYAR